MAETTFGERLRYALFLIGWNTGAEPTQTQMAEAVGLTQPAVRDWLDRAEPPTNYKHHDALVAFAQAPKDWLLFGRGEAPEPRLWELWVQRHARRQGADAGELEPPAAGAELQVNQQRATESRGAVTDVEGGAAIPAEHPTKRSAGKKAPDKKRRQA